MNDHILDENNDTKVEMSVLCFSLSNTHCIVRLTCSFSIRDSLIKFALCVLTRSCNFQGCGQIPGNAMYNCLSFII